MEPVLKRIGENLDTSFQILIVDEPQFYPAWHFHPEFEIILILKGKGDLYIRDSIQNFGPGDLFMTGPNIPHLYKSIPEDEKNNPAHAIVIYFKEDFAGKDLFLLPEAYNIMEFLQHANHGIAFSSKVVNDISSSIRQLPSCYGFNRVIQLLTILNSLSLDHDKKLLTTPTTTVQVKHDKRLDKVFNYVLNNFQGDINLTEASKQAAMNLNAFCRYFKQRTNITFNSFVTEIRISNSRKLLTETTKSIKEIAFESGYNSVPGFSVQFKKHTGISPQTYRILQQKKQNH